MRRILFAVTLLAAAAVAEAHENVSPLWCADGQRVTVSSFRYRQDLAEAFRNAPPSCHGTCGEPDDDYRKISNFTRQLCREREDLRAAGTGEFMNGDVGDIVAIVQGPPAFLAASHHDGYFMAQGIWGICVLCAPPATAPPPPPPR
jgi:hypothetical protein